MTARVDRKFALYLDITPNKMFSLYKNPIADNNGLPTYEKHGHQLKLKEVMLYDKEKTVASPLYRWVAKWKE